MAHFHAKRLSRFWQRCDVFRGIYSCRLLAKFRGSSAFRLTDFQTFQSVVFDEKENRNSEPRDTPDITCGARTPEKPESTPTSTVTKDRELSEVFGAKLAGRGIKGT